MGQLQKPSFKRRKPVAELAAIEHQPLPSPPEEQTDTPSTNEVPQLGDGTTRQVHDSTVKQLAEQLGETEVQPLRQLHSIVKHLGPEQALGFLQETLSIEQNGGLMLADGSRRRAPGGVFFYLVRTKGPKEVKRLFYNQHPRKARPTGEKPTPAAITSAPAQTQTPFTWVDRIAALDEI